MFVLYANDIFMQMHYRFESSARQAIVLQRVLALLWQVAGLQKAMDENSYSIRKLFSPAWQVDQVVPIS